MRCRHRFLLSWIVAGFYIAIGSPPVLGQVEADRGVLRDTVSVQDSVRTLLKQAQKLVSAITSPDELPFGYNIFGLGPETFEPPALGAIDPGYPVGPGDEVVISVWGQVELNHSLPVDQDGSITIPKVGRLQVGGVALGDLQKRVARFLSRAYSGIREDPEQATAFVDVSLGKLRPIKVYVVGEVQMPGGYTLSAASTVLTALYQAVGPTVKGSLRDIRVHRHDRLVGSVDLYRYILEGDKSEDVRLQNGDVVVVPPVGKIVRLKGRVHRPAIYELRDEEGLVRLIEIAGGLEPDAYAGRMQIERIVENRGREVIDVDFAEVRGDPDRDVAIQDGDIVTVFEVQSRIENAVFLEGFVRRPGRYQFRTGMRAGDLIREADGVWPEAFPGRADIVRTNPDLTREVVRFHLRRALEGDPEADLPLRPLDVVKVYSIHTFGLEEFVSVEGRVKKPGRYELLSGMTLKDLIVQAGGLAEGAYESAVEISRVVGDSTGPTEILHMAIDGDYGLNGPQVGFPLRHRDMVFVRPDPSFEPQRNVRVAGEVMLPGAYTLLRRQERLSSLIDRAGGLRETAYAEGCRFSRNGGRMDVRLNEALKHPGGRDDPILEDGDEIVIPRNPGVVSVEGAVFNPRPVRHIKGKNIGYYLNQAGGLTEAADRGRIYVVLANGETLTPGRFLFWRLWPEVDPGSRIVVPSKEGSPSK